MVLSAIKGISALSFACSQIYLSSAVYLGMPSIATSIPGTDLFIGEDAPFQNCSKSGFSTNGVLCIAKKNSSALEEAMHTNNAWLDFFKARWDAFLKHENTIDSMGLLAMIFWQLYIKR